jgi:hypothetical protein
VCLSPPLPLPPPSGPRLGLAAEFRSEKIPQNSLGTACVIPRKKVLIPRHSEVTEESIPKLGTEGNGMKKISFTKNPAPSNRIDRLFSSETCFGTEFRVVVSSAEWFITEFRAFASNFVPWYRIPSIFLLCGTVRNGIPRIFCSAEQPEFRQNKPIVPSIPSSAE